MTTVEAISAGCVPVIINKGRQPEIIEDKISGFLFDTVENLKNYTFELISDDVLWGKMSEACIVRSQEFSLSKFETRVMEIFGC